MHRPPKRRSGLSLAFLFQLGLLRYGTRTGRWWLERLNVFERYKVLTGLEENAGQLNMSGNRKGLVLGGLGRGHGRVAVHPNGIADLCCQVGETNYPRVVFLSDYTCRDEDVGPWSDRTRQVVRFPAMAVGCPPRSA